MGTQTDKHRTAADKLQDDVRQEAKRVWMKPVDQMSRPEVEAHFVQAAKANHITLIAFIDQVYERLVDDLVSDSEHLDWFRRNFPRR